MIAVTGGAGFIGSAFVSKLNSMGIDDILIVDNLGESEKWKNLVGKRYADYIHKDKFIEKLESGALKINAFMHLGACSSTTEKNADYLMENNYRYTQTLAKWALKNKARFIYASSAATYGDGGCGFADDESKLYELQPLNMYGYSKHIFDLWALNNKVLNKITGIKFFNVFGPNEYHKADMVSMIYRAFHQISQTGKIKLFKSYKSEYKDGGQLRDFVYVKDCVDIMWDMYEKPAYGIYNIGTGAARSWNDLASAVFKAMNKPEQIEYIDMPESIKDKYQYFTQADMTKLKSTGCKASFRTLEESVADYVKNYLVPNKHL